MNDTECLIKEKSFPFIILAVLCSLSGLVAVFGNVLVLLAIYTTRSLRTTSNLFIASLAASDLLVGSIMDPILAVRTIRYSYLVTLYCYFGIFRAARKQLKRIVNETTTKTSKETRRLEEARHRKTAWTIGIVIALFFFLWFPSLVVAAVNLTLPDGCKKTYFAQTVWIWIEWIAYLSSAVNPWVYSMRSAEFRTACKLSLGLQRARVIPEEMISRSKARPSVIDNAGIPGVASINLSTNTLNGYPTSKRSDDKNSNYLLPPVS
ncbi:5-hydroxytryptamine receptor 1B [Exaiptasia diaphana]|nr:5-hydroxytryptamine receptor 1B [Exaiptasia diaphana]